MTSPLQYEAHHYRELKERLKDAFPDLDDETMADTLEGESGLPDMLAALIRSAQIDEDYALGTRARISRLSDRAAWLKDRADKKKRIAMNMMADVGLKRLTPGDMTVSRSKSAPGVQVIEEKDIIPKYWKPGKPILDKAAIRDDLKAGIHVDGCVLKNAGDKLTVRI